jgi:hypothetical protein
MDFPYEPKIIFIIPVILIINIIIIIVIIIIIIIHFHSNHIVSIQLHLDFNRQVIIHLHLLFIFPLIKIPSIKIMVIVFNFMSVRRFVIFISDCQNLWFAKMQRDHHENSIQKCLHPLQLLLLMYLSYIRYLCHFNVLSLLMNYRDLSRKIRNPRPLLINHRQHLLKILSFRK